MSTNRLATGVPDFTGEWATRDGRRVRVTELVDCYWEGVIADAQGQFPETPQHYWDAAGHAFGSPGLDLMDRRREGADYK
jgi:hypothetical protein